MENRADKCYSVNLYLGVSDKGDANRKFSLHPTREGLGASLLLVFKVQDANDPVHLVWNLFPGVTFQLEMETNPAEKTCVYRKEKSLSHKRFTWYISARTYVCVRPLETESCEHLGEEEQVLSDGEIIEQDVVLRTQSQAAADQSHVLTDVIAIYVGPAAGGRK